MNKRNQWIIQWCAAVLTLVLGAVACGPQAFVPSTIRSRQSAAGSITIPAKIDIVFGVSQNQTMLNIYPNFQNQIPPFLSDLENSGWDYRFVGIPLGQNSINTPSLFSISNKVSVSRYDGNTPQEKWLPSEPGMLYGNAPKLPLNLLAPAFLIPAPPPTVQLGYEYGLKNQYEFLKRADVNSETTGILRKNAILAVITLSNGEDRSYGTPPPSNSGLSWSYNDNATQTAINGIRNVKSHNPSLVKYFSLVAGYQTYCASSIPNTFYWGKRYEIFASQLNGMSVDICTTSLSSALATIGQNIKGTPLPYKRKYLVIPSEPDPSSIQVIKYPNGDTSNPVTLPQSATNGWTYIGFQTGKHTIVEPEAMDLRDGYMIELNGSAILGGSDLADVVYRNAGEVTSN